MTTTDLHTRLTAAITARLDVARDAKQHRDEWPMPPWFTADHLVQDMHHGRDDAEHIASWDPTTAIRVLEALREELDEHSPREFHAMGSLCEGCSITEGDGVLRFIEWPCRIVRRWSGALGVEVE